MSFRKSAVAILVGRDAGGLRVLVGRRSPRSRFLGGFVAFPGGVHEPADGDLERDGEEVCLRRTASRELLEEAGLRVEPEQFARAGRRLSPPFTPVRFDSLMFAAFPSSLAPPQPSTPELEDVAWERPADLVQRWRELRIRIAPPVLPLLQALAAIPASTPDAEIAAALVQVNTFPDDVGPRIEFVPDVFLVPQRTPTLLPATTTNCYLVGRKEILILDPGSDDPLERARLGNQIDLRERAGGRAHAIVLTHHHVDHVGGALQLARERSLPVWAHAETFARWSDSAAAAKHGLRELEDGEEIALAGGERIAVLHTPGHAPGHVALFETTLGSLFAGDLVSGVSTVLIDSAPGSLDRYLESIRRLRDVPARTLFPAHGPPMIDPPRALQSVLDHRAEREARILASLAGASRTIEEVVTHAYADTPGADPTLAARQARVHLARLEDHGRVRRSGDRWEAVSTATEARPPPGP